MSGTAKAPALPGRAPNKSDLAGLAASWITPELAAAAHLRRVNREEGGELVLEENRRAKMDCAGLAFPYIWPGESRAREWRIRRDNPQPDPVSGKVVQKYMGPPGRSSLFYFAPGVLPHHLEDIKIPVVIVEGEKKTLALQRLAMHERTEEQAPRWIAVGIAGVWNWRKNRSEQNALAGTTAHITEPIEDFGRLAWENRLVWICFDADVAVNKQVHRARWSLARELMHNRKAHVKYVEIPLEEEQKGIDDLLGAQGPEKGLCLFDNARPADVMEDVRRLVESAANHKDAIAMLYEPIHIGLLAQLGSLQWAKVKDLLRTRFGSDFRPTDFEKLIKENKIERERERAALRAAKPQDKGLEFDTNEFGIWQWQFREGQRQARQLTNFTALIDSDQRLDDGEKSDPTFVVLAKFGGVEGRFELKPDEMTEMKWPVKKLHGRASVIPGVTPQQAFYAIQCLSTELRYETAYLHTGWRWMDRDGQWVYLHRGGALGENGNSSDIVVQLPGKQLDRFWLPDPADRSDEIRDSIVETMRFLSLAPDHVTFPLFAGGFRAALGCGCSVSLFAVGPTQVGKSELAALIQQLYGPKFNSKRLPANWGDTTTSLEGKLFALKDAICVVDEFKPTGSDNDVHRKHRYADEILRAQGNQSGKARSNADLTLRTERWPRGMILATGEDLPREQSCRARLVTVEVEPGMVRFGEPLADAQKAAKDGVYALCMAGFLQWLAPIYGQVEHELEDALNESRLKPRGSWKSQRAPDNLVQISVGFEYFLRYAKARGALTQTQAERMKDRAEAAFRELLRDQERQHTASEPCRIYVDAIVSALASGQAHLADPQGLEPKNCQRWGWREDRLGDSVIRRPMGARLGWVDGDDVFLEPGVAFAMAKQAAKTMGDNITVTAYTMNKRLRERGYLAEWNEPRKENTVRRTLEGARRQVIALRPEVLDRSENPASQETNPASPPGIPPGINDDDSDGYGPVAGLAGFDSPPCIGEPEEVAL